MLHCFYQNAIFSAAADKHPMQWADRNVFLHYPAVHTKTSDKCGVKCIKSASSPPWCGMHQRTKLGKNAVREGSTVVNDGVNNGVKSAKYVAIPPIAC